MKGIDKSVLYQVVLHLVLSTHASSIIEIHFLGGNSGVNTWIQAQVRIVPKGSSVERSRHRHGFSHAWN